MNQSDQCPLCTNKKIKDVISFIPGFISQDQLEINANQVIANKNKITILITAVAKKKLDRRRKNLDSTQYFTPKSCHTPM